MGMFNTDGKAIMIVFIGAIITATFLATIGNSIFTETNIITVENTTVSGAAVNTTLDLGGRELLATIDILNATDDASLVGAGASLQTGKGTNGLLSVQLILNDTAADYAGEDIKVSYTANPDGYISDIGGRAIAGLILIFSALAILVFVIVVFIKEGSMGRLMGRQ